jgi:hypothetical protein
MDLDPENRVGDQETGSPGRPVSSGLQVPGDPEYCQRCLCDKHINVQHKSKGLSRYFLHPTGSMNKPIYVPYPRDSCLYYLPEKHCMLFIEKHCRI